MKFLQTWREFGKWSQYSFLAKLHKKGVLTWQVQIIGIFWPSFVSSQSFNRFWRTVIQYSKNREFYKKVAFTKILFLLIFKQIENMKTARWEIDSQRRIKWFHVKAGVKWTLFAINITAQWFHLLQQIYYIFLLKFSKMLHYLPSNNYSFNRCWGLDNMWAYNWLLT